MRNPNRYEITEIIETYLDMISHYNNGEGADHLFAALAKWEAARAALGAE